MQPDMHRLFGDCYKLYVKGMRSAVRERLTRSFGDSWWDSGVLVALSEEQRDQLNTVLGRTETLERVTNLDAVHFAAIVRRHHAKAFAEAFPDFDRATALLREVVYSRNEWAHVSPAGPSRSAISAMVSLLAMLGCREVMEVQRMLDNENQRSGTQDKASSLTQGRDADDADATVPLGLWRELQSYLAVDATIVEASGQSKGVVVKVRVTNIAPLGEGRPDVRFDQVRLIVRGMREERSVPLGSLEPGASVDHEFGVAHRQLVAVSFEARGKLDLARFFEIGRRAALPAYAVNPLLEEFVRCFDQLDIGAPIRLALPAVQAVGSNMTLADAQLVRQSLTDARQGVKEKEAGLVGLHRDFHLTQESQLGTIATKLRRVMRDAEQRLASVDEAIGRTDPEAVRSAIRGLEDVQIAMLQVAEETRRLRV